MMDEHFVADTGSGVNRRGRFILLFGTPALRKTDSLQQAAKRSLVDDLWSGGNLRGVLQFVADDRSQLASRERAIDLDAHVPDLACRGDEEGSALERQAVESSALDMHDDIRGVDPLHESGERRRILHAFSENDTYIRRFGANMRPRIWRRPCRGRPEREKKDDTA